MLLFNKHESFKVVWINVQHSMDYCYLPWYPTVDLCCQDFVFNHDPRAVITSLHINCVQVVLQLDVFQDPGSHPTQTKQQQQQPCFPAQFAPLRQKKLLVAQAWGRRTAACSHILSWGLLYYTVGAASVYFSTAWLNNQSFNCNFHPNAPINVGIDQLQSWLTWEAVECLRELL